MDQRHVPLYLYLQNDDWSSSGALFPSLLVSSQPNEEVASRCETVLNTTMAEIETYHTQKVEDFASLAKEHLDGEIEFYEQVSGIKNR
jgi:WASP-binding domain of Sorting nexin protein